MQPHYTTNLPVGTGGTTIVYMDGGKKGMKIFPLIGAALIFISLFMPYASMFGESINGFELMGEMTELMAMSDSDSGGGDGFGDDAPSELIFLGIAAMLFAFSPFVFLGSSILAGILTLAGRGVKVVGGLHIGYAMIAMVCTALGTIDLGFLGSFSLFDFYDFGFYIGCFGSILYMVDA